MPKVLVIVILLFQLVFIIGSHHTTNRVSVYYESICPDSRRFILNQLIPTYDKLSQYIDIDLIPFGNANVSYPNHDFKPYFQCQHGPKECYGNKAQACVIDLTKSTRPSLNYIKCMFSADNWRETNITAQKCADSISMNWTQIKECIEGPHGDRLLVAYSHRTFNLEPPHRFIPWILIDGMHTEEIQSRSLFNLMQYLCEAHHSNHEPKLSECSEKTLQHIQSQFSSSLNLRISFSISIISLIITLFHFKKSLQNNSPFLH